MSIHRNRSEMVNPASLAMSPIVGYVWEALNRAGDLRRGSTHRHGENTMAIHLSTDFGARVAKRLEEEGIVWLTTTSADGTPQPNPVWFLWNGDNVLIFSEPNQASPATTGA